MSKESIKQINTERKWLTIWIKNLLKICKNFDFKNVIVFAQVKVSRFFLLF